MVLKKFHLQSTTRMRQRWKLERNDKKVEDPPNLSNIHIIEPTKMKSRKSRESSKKTVSKNTLELKYMSH